MQVNGSCHCGSITFTVDAPEPVPFLRCYCSICRKTAGAGGFGINLGARVASLSIAGEEHIRRYDPVSGDVGTGATGEAGRRFCGRCGSPLWNFDPRWPELLHPHAGAIDTDLPEPPERTHMMLGSAASWAQPNVRDGDRSFQEYPDESLAIWHARVLGDNVDR
ncbi:MAG: GFA family protein [Hyphomicrobiaceae bacterium]